MKQKLLELAKALGNAASTALPVWLSQFTTNCTTAFQDPLPRRLALRSPSPPYTYCSATILVRLSHHFLEFVK